jgi:hypothetical protein
VGVLTQDPVLAFAAGITSHLICDCIPHVDSPFDIKYVNDQIDNPVWTKQFMIAALVDSIIAFILTLIVWQQLFNLDFYSPYAWGALGAYLPDLIDVAPFWAKYFQRLPGFAQFHRLHLATHKLWIHRFPMPKYKILGTVSQIVFILPCLWYLFK